MFQHEIPSCNLCFWRRSITWLAKSYHGGILSSSRLGFLLVSCGVRSGDFRTMISMYRRLFSAGYVSGVSWELSIVIPSLLTTTLHSESSARDESQFMQRIKSIFKISKNKRSCMIKELLVGSVNHLVCIYVIHHKMYAYNAGIVTRQSRITP